MSEFKKVDIKEHLPNDELYELLVEYRNTPIHLWMGSDNERTRIAYNKTVDLIQAALREVLERLSRSCVCDAVDAELAALSSDIGKEKPE